jgi:hypothetical protein
MRNIGNPTTLEELEVNHLSNIDQVPSQQQILNLSIYLRNFARNLSPNLPVKSPIIKTPTIIYQITDIKLSDDTWNTLTIGHALRLITQEIEIMRNSQAQPRIQVLLKNNFSSIYHPLIDLPLNQFCNLLLTEIKSSSNSI